MPCWQKITEKQKKELVISQLLHKNIMHADAREIRCEHSIMFWIEERVHNEYYCVFIIFNGLKMLTQRKRFNYNVGNTHTSTSQKKTFVSSAIKPNLITPREDVTLTKFREEKENNKKVEELQEVNKRLIEETTKQFKKLQADVQRVQKILEEKENALEESHRQNQNLRVGLQKVEEEKKILIEAIFQKDLVIKQYEEKLKQLLAARTPIHTTPEKEAKPQLEQQGSQTDALPQTCPKQQLTSLLSQNLGLQEQLYRVREQLFDANNKVKVLQHQFEAYKILKQIESVQEV